MSISAGGSLKNALQSFMGAVGISVSELAQILNLFLSRSRVDYEEIAAINSGSLDDALLTLWEWKLIIPVSSSQCSEWDRRVLLAQPGEYYEMPNISRVLVEKGMTTGRWESFAAIRELFQTMGELEWEIMPKLVQNIRQETSYNTIDGARIGAACTRCGLGTKTGAMIAILKGAGIISPKLAAFNPVAQSRSPLYEFNPCVYAEETAWKVTKLDPVQPGDNRLCNALSLFFPERDAYLLAGILDGMLDGDTVRISDRDLAQHQMKELLLLAFDERLLIPIDSRGGPAWEEKVMGFHREALFLIPPVVKAVVHTIYETGQPSCAKAVQAAISETSSENCAEFIRMLQTIMKHASDRMFEVGLLEILSKSIPGNLVLHDFIDISVACGLMSPCPRKSLLTGLSWYEINPVLYWDKTFLE